MRLILQSLSAIAALAIAGVAASCNVDCVDSCYFANIPASNCPDSSNPEALATAEYITCICQTINAPAYLFCVHQHCGDQSEMPIEGVFADWCAFNGGIGPWPCANPDYSGNGSPAVDAQVGLVGHGSAIPAVHAGVGASGRVVSAAAEE